MRKIIYISGPISGTNDADKRFSEAKEYLLYEMGCFEVFPQFPDGPFDSCEVVNPIEITKHLPPHTKWATYMEILIPILKTCDAVYMLQGWERSKGAQIEKLFAEACGMDIGYEDPQPICKEPETDPFI